MTRQKRSPVCSHLFPIHLHNTNQKMQRRTHSYRYKRTTNSIEVWVTILFWVLSRLTHKRILNLFHNSLSVLNFLSRQRGTYFWDNSNFVASPPAHASLSSLSGTLWVVFLPPLLTGIPTFLVSWAWLPMIKFKINRVQEQNQMKKMEKNKKQLIFKSQAPFRILAVCLLSNQRMRKNKKFNHWKIEMLASLKKTERQHFNKPYSGNVSSDSFWTHVSF